jgi:hypothetical protein
MNHAEFWSRFQLFFLWGLQAWRIPPLLITGLASMTSLIFSLFRSPELKRRWRASYWLIFTQLAFYPLAIAVGVLYPAVSTSPFDRYRSNSHGEHILDALTLLSLGMASFWVYRMKGLRWLACSLVALQEVAIWGALFIAGMSVSGDWV